MSTSDTPAGRDLERVIVAVRMGGAVDVRRPRTPLEVDPVTLTWWMSRRSIPRPLPEDRGDLQFEYRGEDPTRIWMVLEQAREPRSAPTPPGSTPTSSSPPNPWTWMRVFSGIITMRQASANRTDRPRRPTPAHPGPAELVSWSPFAPAVRERIS